MRGGKSVEQNHPFFSEVNNHSFASLQVLIPLCEFIIHINFHYYFLYKSLVSPVREHRKIAITINMKAAYTTIFDIQRNSLDISVYYQFNPTRLKPRVPGDYRIFHFVIYLVLCLKFNNLTEDRTNISVL